MPNRSRPRPAQRVRSGAGSRVAVPIAVLGAVSLALAGLAGPAPAAEPDPAPVVVVDESVSTAARLLTRGVGDRELVRVSALQRTADGVAVVEERVRGRAAATRAVRDLQADSATASVALANRMTIATSDTEYPQQWAMPRLRLPEAWDASTGADVTVAVIDTGVDVEHPDLAGQLLPGVNVIGSAVDPDVQDGHGHGTHVSGTIAAVTDNSLGVAGVAPDAAILPVKVLSDTGSGWSSDVAEGIVYAADHGARVLNLSLAGGSNNSVLEQAVNYARAQGVVVVAAGGNSGATSNAPAYPAALPGVIAVAATDATDHNAAFSNTGRYIDVAAPGVAIRSTLPGESYGNLSGTSMAAPHVAGTAALLLARMDQHGSVDVDDPVLELLIRTATDVGAPGWDDATGYGLIDPVAALQAVTDGLPPARPGPPDEPVVTPPAEAPVTAPEPTPTPTPEPTTTPTPEPAPLRPGAPRALRVRLGRPPVTIRWNAPRTGNAARYTTRLGRVKAGRVDWRRTRSSKASKMTARVSRGRWRIEVAAVNDVGVGPASRRNFTITRQMLRLPR